MAKRFTDTDKWKDDWFSNLPNDYKVIWIYLLDTCDHAGVYKRNIKLLNFNCNTNVTEEDLLKHFEKRLTIISDDKWVINKFCTFQYGDNFLNGKPNKAIQSAIDILNNLNLISRDDKGYLTLTIPLDKGYLTPKDKDKAQEQYKDKFKNKAQELDMDKFKYKAKELDKVFSDIEKHLNK